MCLRWWSEDTSYVRLLTADTVVKPNSLTLPIVSFARFHSPSTIQSCAGVLRYLSFFTASSYVFFQFFRYETQCLDSFLIDEFLELLWSLWENWQRKQVGYIDKMTEVQKGMSNKRHIGSKKRNGRAKKKQKTMPFNEKKVRIDKKMKKLFQKRAREYHSDDDDDDDKDDDSDRVVEELGDMAFHGKNDEFEDDTSHDEEGDVEEKNDESEDEGGEIQPGITKFMEGCKAFKIAFKKIQKKTASDDVLGPVLSAHKKLVAEKLAEEETERKVKVVKLFNAVNKAQHAQRGLNPARSRDEKIIKKRKKDAFFSELGKSSSQSGGIFQKGDTSVGAKDNDGPVWAPLRDNYMLTHQKLKDWDKQQDTATGDDFRMASADSSSDDD
ncbi:hypothetical protein DM860_009309 [Cuscuta australis]|uniref:RRP15-like protein n=1 Tax=Cuscuta australis TaxID=267555 RepID=A0A328DAD3_9ASTE|nr:hypothetical protein DM860_009309 [Cuscuta australis]